MKIAIFGATSAIAQSVTKIYAKQKEHTLYLFARNKNKLEDITSDLKNNYKAKIYSESFDFTNFELTKNKINEYFQSKNNLNYTLIAQGVLTNQNTSLNSLKKDFDVNFFSVVNILDHLIPLCKTIGVISTVAADRGRASNYLYASSKSALNTYLSGLQLRKDISSSIVIIKPGFVDTPMTKNFQKGILWASPEKIAKDIVKNLQKSKRIFYTPYYWKIIMFIIRNLPYKLLKKLNI